MTAVLIYDFLCASDITSFIFCPESASITRTGDIFTGFADSCINLVNIFCDRFLASYLCISSDSERLGVVRHLRCRYSRTAVEHVSQWSMQDVAKRMNLGDGFLVTNSCGHCVPVFWIQSLGQ